MKVFNIFNPQGYINHNCSMTLYPPSRNGYNKEKKQ